MIGVRLLLAEKFTVDSDRGLPFKETDRIRHTVLGGNTQAQVNVVGHRMSLDEFNSLLSAQLTQDPADLTSQVAENRPTPILRDEHNVVFTVRFHMELALPISHDDLLPVWLIGGMSSTTSQRAPERQSLGESTAKGGGLPVTSYPYF
jgi:hypothetical protein